MTTYLSRAVRDQLRAAQRDVDRHVGAGPTGHCLACGNPQPCPTLDAAQAVFARYRQLPLRRPGRTVHAVPATASHADPARPAYDWFARNHPRSATDAA
jgi:hypothetical protein